MLLRDKKKWRADHGARGLRLIGKIEASITALADDDLLDLHDIFSGPPASPLGDMASAEMTRRKLVA